MTGTPTLCLWYDRNAEEAATFYAATFPDTHVGAVQRAPGDYPDGHEGDALTVEFTVMGLPCVGLNGGPHFKHSEAFSFMVPAGLLDDDPGFRGYAAHIFVGSKAPWVCISDAAPQYDEGFDSQRLDR